MKGAGRRGFRVKGLEGLGFGSIIPIMESQMERTWKMKRRLGENWIGIAKRMGTVLGSL